MSYAIGYVIYGVPLDRKVRELAVPFVDWEGIKPDLAEVEPEEIGFKGFYSGRGDLLPGYLGVRVGEIDECSNVDLTEELPTWQQKASESAEDYNKALAKVPDGLREALPPPRLWIVWGTS